MLVFVRLLPSQLLKIFLVFGLSLLHLIYPSWSGLLLIWAGLILVNASHYRLFALLVLLCSYLLSLWNSSLLANHISYEGVIMSTDKSFVLVLSSFLATEIGLVGFPLPCSAALSLTILLNL